MGRPSLEGRGDLLKDEDEEIVNKNDPRNKHVKPEDIADNSYLSYGESNDDGDQDLDEDNYMLTDEEIEKEAQEKERALSFKKQSELEWSEDYSEIKSVTNGEVVHSNSKEFIENLNGDSKDESLNKETLEIKPISGRMRAEAWRVYNKGYIAPDKNRGNLKTELPSKRKRRNRGLLRGLFKN